jgi:ketosteroid isomerase-like protein
MRIHHIVLIPLAIIGCQSNPDPKVVKSEIIEVEQAFCEMAKSEGLATAFAHFAAEDAVIKRGGRLLKGKDSIRQFYLDSDGTEVSLIWAPDFIDVSKSGDLAYTWGPFEYFTIKSTGDTIISAGVFHTVWKRQDNGEWRYVYD